MIIDEIVENYFDAISANLAVCQVNLKVCVFNVVPAAKKEGIPENAEFPFLGTDEERKQYVLYFNKKLGEKCREFGFVFFDVYDRYTDENGFFNKALCDGAGVHIQKGSYLEDFIRDNLLQQN